MQIIIDADACPKVIKEIIFRAAEKNSISVTLVANSFFRIPPNPNFKLITVPNAFNEADDKITEIVLPGNLVITSDIPLSDRIIKKGAFALDSRGNFISEHNIGSRLAVRDLLHELRECGLQTGGPPPISTKERQQFAQALQYFISHNDVP